MTVGIERVEVCGSCCDHQFGHTHSSGNGSSCKSEFWRRLASKCKRHKRIDSQDIMPGACRTDALARCSSRDIEQGDVLNGGGTIGLLQKDEGRGLGSWIVGAGNGCRLPLQKEREAFEEQNRFLKNNVQ